MILAADSIGIWHSTPAAMARSLLISVGRCHSVCPCRPGRRSEVTGDRFCSTAWERTSRSARRKPAAGIRLPLLASLWSDAALLRARDAPSGGAHEPMLLVGGTASITGEESRHLDVLGGTVSRDVLNLASVVASAVGRILPEDAAQRSRPAAELSRVACVLPGSEHRDTLVHGAGRFLTAVPGGVAAGFPVPAGAPGRNRGRRFPNPPPRPRGYQRSPFLPIRGSNATTAVMASVRPSSTTCSTRGAVLRVGVPRHVVGDRRAVSEARAPHRRAWKGDADTGCRDRHWPRASLRQRAHRNRGPFRRPRSQPGMLQECRKRCAAPLILGRGEHLPFVSEHFDMVSMGYGLRHVADLNALFDEYRRVLKPGGRLLLLEITQPASATGRRLNELLLGTLIPGLARSGAGRRRRA